jgi:predicted metalloprotease with PDZ domain
MILTVFRRDELMRFRVSLQAPPADTCYLLMKDDCAADKEQRRQDWLAGAGL